MTYTNRKLGGKLLTIGKTNRVLSLPYLFRRMTKNRIQEKVFNQIGLENLKKENGLDIYIDFLDSLMMKDELSDSLEKFE